MLAAARVAGTGPEAEVGQPVAPEDSGPVEVDTSVPHPSRVYDYLLGGIDNFAVDRDAAARACAGLGGLERARHDLRANRSFLGWSVRHLAGPLRVDQFLDVGTGIPGADHVHAVARAVAPEARVVYVDNDPVVLTHAHEVLRGAPAETTAYLDGDLRDPDRILDRAAATLDLDRPVAVLLTTVLHRLGDPEAARVVGRLMAPLVPGSHLVITHMARDIEAARMTRVTRRLAGALGAPPVLRTQDEVARFLAGLDAVAPGVVAFDDWPAYDGKPVPPAGRRTPLYVGIGRAG
jgi:S-adenosyl methyltransferase